MILASIKSISTYAILHPSFTEVFNYIANTDLDALESGRIELDGSRLFLLPQRAKGEEAKNVELEAHKRYIDIQIPLSAPETFGWKSTANCQIETTPYSNEKDICLFGDQPDCYFTVYPGQVLILFPDDAHAPCIGEGTIQKIVFKILIA